MNKFLLASSGSMIVDDRARRQNRKTTPVLPSPLFGGRRCAGAGCARSAPPWGIEAGRGWGAWRVLQPGAWGATLPKCGERHLGTQPALCGEPSKAPRPCQRLRGSPRGSGKYAPLPFRPPEAGGALSVGPAQLLSRFRRARKVRLGGTAAPGHAGASGCPECPASHPPPPAAFLQLYCLPSSGFTAEAPARGNQTRYSFGSYSLTF